MDLRTAVGRVWSVDLPGWRRDPDPEPRRKIAEPLLSRAARSDPVAIACSLRARWRNRHRQEQGARLRGAAAPPSPRCLAREAAVPGDSGVHRVLRPALRGGPGTTRRAVPNPATLAGIAACICGDGDP